MITLLYKSLGSNQAQITLTVNDNNYVTLFSYDSPIVTRLQPTNKLILHEDWDYSRTTAKHRTAFLNGITTAELVKKLLHNEIKIMSYNEMINQV
jgi:hypothetical protein